MLDEMIPASSQDIGRIINRIGATPPTLAELLELRDLAEQTALSGAAHSMLEELSPPSTAAAFWTRAALFEHAQDAQSALGVLEVMPELPWGDARSQRWLALARLRGRLGRAGAGIALREAVRSAASFRMLRLTDNLLREFGRKSVPLPALRPYRIAVLGTFTVDLVIQALRPLLFAAGIAADFWIAPFGQIQQTLLGGDPALAEFQPQMILLATDWRSVDSKNSVEDHLAGLRELWQVARERYSAAVAQFNYAVPSLDPLGRLSAVLPFGRKRLLESVNAALWEAEAKQSGAVILDVNQIAAEFGTDRWEDPTAWEISRQYPSSEATPALARRLTSLVRAILGMSSKCLVLDLDGVLWGGVIGEDGPAGIQLGGTSSGAAYAAFQAYCKGLQQRGVLLAVCSKNNPEDAILPFREHPEMVLKEEDIAVFLANWQPKEENIQGIAKAINIGLDSLVFVDDNPAERERIRQQLPMVEVVELPADPARYAQALHNLHCFESLAFTEEDLLRTSSIRANTQREALGAGETGSADYLHRLDMSLMAQSFNDTNLPRIVQLFNKTNQFNLTTRRITDADATHWMHAPDWFTLTVRLKDRFGDFGLTGILVAVQEQDRLRIDSWLMSCRILGRGVEQAMLAMTLTEARRRGCRELTGEYISTAKNKMVQDLYLKSGFTACLAAPDGPSRYYSLAVESADIAIPPYLRAETP